MTPGGVRWIVALIAASAPGAVATGVGRPWAGQADPATVLAQAQAHYQAGRFDAAAAGATRSLNNKPPQRSVSIPRQRHLGPQPTAPHGVLVVVASPFLNVVRLDPVRRPAVALSRPADE